MTAPRVLVVCTGNLCRSVLAAELMRDLARNEPVAAHGAPRPPEVRSAGTAAAVGERVPAALAASVPSLSSSARERIGAHRPVQLTATDVRAADLVLTAAREHRAAVVSLVPAATRRTFTLREFARIVEHVGTTAPGGGRDGRAAEDDQLGRIRAGITELAACRGPAPRPLDPADDDVVDPHRRSAEVFATSAQQITDAVRVVARFLTS